MLKEGRLPTETSLPFRRNILTIAQSARAHGSTVVLMTVPHSAKMTASYRAGTDEHNAHLRDLCREHGFLLADAALDFAARPELAQEFIDQVHLDPAGNLAKAELVVHALTGWIARLPPPDPAPGKQQGSPR